MWQMTAYERGELEIIHPARTGLAVVRIVFRCRTKKIEIEVPVGLFGVALGSVPVSATVEVQSDE